MSLDSAPNNLIEKTSFTSTPATPAGLDDFRLGGSQTREMMPTRTAAKPEDFLVMAPAPADGGDTQAAEPPLPEAPIVSRAQQVKEYAAMQNNGHPEDAKLQEKILMGKGTRADKAKYIGYEEFQELPARALVEKEVLGTITPSERAKLAGWREFPFAENAGKRQLVTMEFLKTASKTDLATLHSWRQFPEGKYSRARDLVVKEETSSLSEQETKELADWREKPRIPIFGSFAISFGPSQAKPPDADKPRAERIKNIAEKEFPKDPHGQELVLKYMLGDLTRPEAAELGALREFPDNAVARKLAESESLGQIKGADKAVLHSWREFETPGADGDRARLLSVKETTGTATKGELAELAARREFKGDTFGGLKVQVPANAVALCTKEILGTITRSEAAQLKQARMEYRKSENKAQEDSWAK